MGRLSPRATGWTIVGALTLLRLVAAFRLPLTGDEAYYWTWSRHLAFGYVDHPPMVAWLIALGSQLGHAPGCVRLPFVIAEAAAALALGAAAARLAGTERAGLIAIVAFSCIPEQKLAIGEALPDGPYVLFWALALALAARAIRAPAAVTPWDGAGLGLCLGGAVLSRAFGWALVAGVLLVLAAPRTREAYRRGLSLAVPVLLVAYAPFVWWNATHGWANLAFTVHDRQPFDAAALARHGLLSTIRFAVYAVPLLAVAAAVSLRRPPRPLVAATALPLLAGLLVLAPVYPIESYWILGPAVSIAVGVGASAACRSSRRLGLVAAPFVAALVLTEGSVLFQALPERSQAAFFRGPGAGLRGTLGSGAFAYGPLARQVTALTARSDDVVMVDRPEIFSELAFAGVDAELVGFSPDLPELRRYRDVPRGDGDALFVRYAPASEDPRLVASLRPLCGRLDPGPVLVERHAGIRSERFFTLWCRRGTDSPLPRG